MRAKTPDEYIDASLASELTPALKARLARSWMRVSGYTVDDIIKARNRHPFWKKMKAQGAAERTKKRQEEHDYSNGVEIVWIPALVGEFLGMNGKDESGHYKNKDWEIAKRFKTSIPSIQYMRRKLALAIKTLGFKAPKPEIVAFLCGIKPADRKPGARKVAESRAAIKPSAERTVRSGGKTGFQAMDKRASHSRGAGSKGAGGTGYGNKNRDRVDPEQENRRGRSAGFSAGRGTERSTNRGMERSSERGNPRENGFSGKGKRPDSKTVRTEGKRAGSAEGRAVDGRTAGKPGGKSPAMRADPRNERRVESRDRRPESTRTEGRTTRSDDRSGLRNDFQDKSRGTGRNDPSKNSRLDVPGSSSRRGDFASRSGKSGNTGKQDGKGRTGERAERKFSPEKRTSGRKDSGRSDGKPNCSK